MGWERRVLLDAGCGMWNAVSSERKMGWAGAEIRCEGGLIPGRGGGGRNGARRDATAELRMRGFRSISVKILARRIQCHIQCPFHSTYGNVVRATSLFGLPFESSRVF